MRKLSADRDSYAARRPRVTPSSSPPVVVLTRSEVLWHETWHWLVNTPIGSIFMAGVALALVVGSVVVYMVLSNDVAGQLKEYATLKAMGYTDGFLRAS